MIKEVVRKFLFIGSYCTGCNVQDFFEQIEQGFEIRSRSFHTIIVHVTVTIKFQTVKLAYLPLTSCQHLKR